MDFFYFFAYRISRRIKNERILALFLIFISALLSMFLTNDIVLFIIVSLTLSLWEISNSDYSKMIVFEAIAVNVGSSLTAIGNPQNIFLWHQWGISFPGFILEMSPLVIILLVWLFVFVFFAFSPKNIKHNHTQHSLVNRKLFFLSTLLLILFILSVEFEFEKYFLIVIFASFLLFNKKVILRAAWELILLFTIIFYKFKSYLSVKRNATFA